MDVLCFLGSKSFLAGFEVSGLENSKMDVFCSLGSKNRQAPTCMRMQICIYIYIHIYTYVFTCNHIHMSRSQRAHIAGSNSSRGEGCGDLLAPDWAC